MRVLTFVFISAALVCSPPSVAAPAQQATGGAVIVRVPDGIEPRCVNPRQDQIWLTLRRVITTRDKRWFTEDKSVALLVDASLQTSPPSSERIAFPLMAQATLQGFSEGQVSVPVEYTVVSGLQLNDAATQFTGLAIELTLLNRSGRNEWGRALEALSETADKLPIPASPLSQTSSYLMSFANSAIEKDLADQDDDDQVRSAALALNFDPAGQCAQANFETTGTLAILHEDGMRGDGYVPINETSSYCWSSEFRPSFILRAARRANGVACGDQSYEDQYREVSNNYVGLFLNAIEAPESLSGVPQQDLDDAGARCMLHGIPLDRCY